MKYREKMAHSVACTARDCTNDASRLLLMSGKPWWVCADHYEELSASEFQRAH